MNERLRFDGSESGRIVEIERFWQGFGRYRQVNRGLEERLGQLLSDETSVEAMMVFTLGVELLRFNKGEMGRKIAVPQLVLVGPDEGVDTFQSWAEGRMIDGQLVGIVKTGISANTRYLASPEDHLSPHTVEFMRKDKKTVSRLLSDRAIVDLVLAGVEEESHEIFQRTKHGEKLLSFIEEAKRIRSAAIEIDAAGHRELAVVVSHSSEIERQGLVDQLGVLDVYLPSFSMPTRRLLGEVERLRRFESDVR